jgi:hypothetical protein
LVVPVRTINTSMVLPATKVEVCERSLQELLPAAMGQEISVLVAVLRTVNVSVLPVGSAADSCT